MENKLTIIYANRNRDVERIRITFDSLKKQTDQNFEVIFVDYGSETSIVNGLRILSELYDFVKFYHLPVPQLLWNKSKALNYGIFKTKSSHIFIADVDLIFHPESTQLLNTLYTPDEFYLFKLGYLDKIESKKLTSHYEFDELKVNKFGVVNGMILSSKVVLDKISGFDEFFHFYGAEDVDLFSRLSMAGLVEVKDDHKYFYHNWHKTFSGSEDDLITNNPRVKNIMRINQQHFNRNKEKGIIKPHRQSPVGSFIKEEISNMLENPTILIKIPNILAHVEYFLNEELPFISGEVIQAEFREDPYFSSIKYKVKKKMGTQTQVYCSLKEINDLVLKKIVFDYRFHNYSFKISSDLKKIIFKIQK